MTNAFSITTIINAPMKIPSIFPLPPRSEVPPTTAAATTLNSHPVPTLEENAPNRSV